MAGHQGTHGEANVVYVSGGEDEALGAGADGEEPLHGPGKMAGDLDGEDEERGNDWHEIAKACGGLEPGILVGGAEEDEEDEIEEEDPKLAWGEKAA
jgi:hypothetical protein